MGIGTPDRNRKANVSRPYRSAGVARGGHAGFEAKWRIRH
jgi:hypothetical protein